MTKTAITKQTGLKHLLAAASYSWGGFRRLLQEAAFRQELVFFAVSLAIVLLCGGTLNEALITSVLFLGLFAVEAMNTAVEEMIDRISPEISSVGKHAKDLGSFAVSCMIMACGLYVLVTVVRHLAGL